MVVFIYLIVYMIIRIDLKDCNEEYIIELNFIFYINFLILRVQV